MNLVEFLITQQQDENNRRYNETVIAQQRENERIVEARRQEQVADNWRIWAADQEKQRAYEEKLAYDKNQAAEWARQDAKEAAAAAAQEAATKSERERAIADREAEKAWAKEQADLADRENDDNLAKQREWDLADKAAAQAREDAAIKKQEDAAAAAKAEALVEAEKKKSLLAAKKVGADSNARASAQSIASSKGVNWAEISPLITPEYDRIRDMIPEGEENPGSYYSNDIINNLLSKTENDRRNSYSNQVKGMFSSGYENKYLPDTADDGYIDKLLTTRKNEAQQAIDFSRSRGQLNDAGYSSAIGRLGEQETAARGTLNSIGNSVIGSKRASFAPIRDSAFDEANSYRLGQNEFDMGQYQERLSSSANDALSGLEGDITNALGNTSLFNINDIILAGGRGQGPQNLTTANIPGRLKKENTDRGLGTTGAF